MKFSCIYLRNQWKVIFIWSSCRSWLNGTIKILKNKTDIIHSIFCCFSFVALKMIHIIKLWSFLILICTVLLILFLKSLCAQLVIKIPSILGEEISIQIWLNSCQHYYSSMTNMVFHYVSCKEELSSNSLFRGLDLLLIQLKPEFDSMHLWLWLNTRNSHNGITPYPLLSASWQADS